MPKDLGASSSKGLRVIADNLDATCLLRINKTKKAPDGTLRSYTDVCTGVLVKEGFILTSARVISGPEDVNDAEAVFFYEAEGTGAGSKVPPVSIPVDPAALFFMSSLPELDKEKMNKERDIDEKHLSYVVVGLDRSQIRPFQPPPEEKTNSRPSTGHGRPSSAARRKSNPLEATSTTNFGRVEDSILAFQEIIPMDIKLNIDLSKGDPVPKPRLRDSVVVIEHRRAGPKDYHQDVVKTVKEFSLNYTIDRRPKTDCRSAGSPIFAQNGEMVAMLSRAGTTSVPHHCVLLRPVLSDLRRHMKACRIKSASMAKRGDFTLAAELMWTAVALNPSPSGDKVIEGLRTTADIVQALKIEEGDLSELDEGLLCHTQAIEFNPRCTDAFVARGLVLHMQTKFADAVRDFSMAIQFEPGVPDFFYYRGHAFYDQGSLENSIADYTNAIQLDGANPVYYLNRGNAHTDLGDLEQAKKDYTSCIGLAPEDENAYFRRGNVLRMMGHLAQAIADYTKVLTLVPGHAAACFQRGLCYYQKAHIDVSRAFKLDPQPEYRRQLMVFRQNDGE